MPGSSSFSLNNNNNNSTAGSSLAAQLLLPNSKIVMDPGSACIKAGFSGENTPRAVLPSILGTPLYAETLTTAMRIKDVYVGSAAQAKRGILNLSYPIRGGVVRDWDGLEKLWEHTLLNELRADPSSSPLFLTEPPLLPKSDREQMVQLLFEKFQVPAVYLAGQASLVLHALGQRSGLVVDLGHGVTHAVPIYDGFCYSHAVQRLDVAGQQLSERMALLLQQSGSAMLSSAEKDIAQHIKETQAYVALDPAQEIQRAALGHGCAAYTMPDGRVVRLGSERFQCSEALFSPQLLGKEAAGGGLQDAVLRAVVQSDVGARRALLANVVLVGGTAQLPGVAERLNRELAMQAPAGVATAVQVPPNPQTLAWVGGSLMAATQTTGWISREDYLKGGPAVVHRFFPSDKMF